MNSESQTALILSQVEIQIAKLELAVQDFEHITAEAEKQFAALEQLEATYVEQNPAALQTFTQILHTSQTAEQQVHMANLPLHDSLKKAEFLLEENRAETEDYREPFPNGHLVCQGQYRLLQLLYKRPRMNLYLAHRLSDMADAKTGEKPLVAIRELVLTGLEDKQRQQVIQAAFEEFAAPRLFGSPHLAGVGDRIYREKGRHYLIMQPRPVRGSRPTVAVTLADFLARLQTGSGWLEMGSALNWGIELCRAVAKLHTMKNVHGELTPEMVLVDREANADWAPILLAGWPPPLLFWSGNEQEARQQSNLVFPLLAVNANQSPEKVSAFVAPEVFVGQCNQRSDVYSLGALLYLLFTHCTPLAAPQRLMAEQSTQRAQPRKWRAPKTNQTMPGLIAPHLLNEQVSLLLEQILLRALALNPEERFRSALDLAEALASMNLKTDVLVPILPHAGVSRLRKLLLWLKKER